MRHSRPPGHHDQHRLSVRLSGSQCTYHEQQHSNHPSSLLTTQPQTITTYYTNPTTPIAALKPLTPSTFIDTRNFRLGEYASKLAHNFPRALSNASATPDPVPLYRTLLASAPNASTTLISLGFLTNLAALLSSPPDTISPLSGSQLVRLRTAELVVMGGRYPSGHEFNFATDAASTRAVLAGWPEDVPITFAGYELGKAIVSGQRLPEWAPKDSPVLAAYQWYGDRCETARASYDPVAVLYGVLGLEGGGRRRGGKVFEFVGEGGCNVVAEDGGNEWKEHCGVGNQRWLKLRDGVREEEVGELLDRMYARRPLDEGCCFGGGECGGSMKVEDRLDRLVGISLEL